MAATKTFSFTDVVKGRDANVRVTDDNMFYAVDLTMVVTGANRDDSGKALRRLSDEVFPSDKLSERTLPGKGNAHTKLVSFDDAILLVMVLPGKVARETRVLFGEIIKRYLAGDKSLIAEIEANAQSASPIAQMARASLAADVVAPAQNEMSLTHKRKLEELEIAKFELEIDAKRNANRLSEIAATVMQRDSEHDHIVKCTTSYTEICRDTVMDERARLIFKDCYLNMAMLQGQKSGGQALLTNGQSNKPISLSQVSRDLGLDIPSNEFISLGMKLRKSYVKKHGKEPTKHDQLCGGRMTKVNSYVESDRDLMEEVLRSHAAESD